MRHLGTIRCERPGQGYTASCSCGWSFQYPLKYDSHAEQVLDLHLQEEAAKAGGQVPERVR